MFLGDGIIMVGNDKYKEIKILLCKGSVLQGIRRAK
jgi:hypothetical protein